MELVITEADVRRSVDTARSSLRSAAEEIVWQIEHEAWRVLGYPDWDAMREAEYGGAAFMVPRQERRELVARLRDAGLTQQQIADTAGVAQTTVSADLSDFASDRCWVDPSNGMSELRDVLRSTDRLLVNFYADPEPHLLDALDAWLTKQQRKVTKARKS